MGSVRNRDVAAVDAFLAESKALKSEIPEWKKSSRRGDVECIWHIIDSAGTERAHLRFRCPIDNRAFPTVLLIFRNYQICRVDCVPDDECKYNPPWAYSVGAPPTVCGNHEHAWQDNRVYLLGIGQQEPPWTTPCRRPLPAAIRRIPQILPWFTEKIGLSMPSCWREFDLPPQTELFAMR